MHKSENISASIISRGDSNLIYPSIKESSNIVKMTLTKDTIPTTTEAITYFSLDFRTCDAVLNTIALHYEVAEDYPLNDSGEETERFLVGPQLSQIYRKEIENQCPYMNKTMEIIKNTKEVSLRDLIAIYLLGIDESDTNKQQFLVMTTNKLFLRDDSLVLQQYNYEDIVLDENGLHLKDSLESMGEPKLVDYPFDMRFSNYFKDFMTMKFAIISAGRERHPFADCSIEYRESYLKFMVDVTVSEHIMSTEQLLYLELLARDFQLGSNKLETFIQERLTKKLSDRKIQEYLINILKNYVPAKYRYVFFQDVLKIAINIEGRLNQNSILKLLSKENYAGEQFVNAYVESIKAENILKEKTQIAFSKIRKRKLTLEPAYQLQYLYCDLFINYLRTGVTYNDFERI